MLKLNTEMPDLICPLCRDKIYASNKFVCNTCNKNFLSNNGILDFRYSNASLNPNRNWKIGEFDKGYKDRGDVKDHFDLARINHIPRAVEEYRYSLVKNRLLDWINVEEGARILDLGCGSGWFIRDMQYKLKGKRNIKYFALDASTVNLNYLENKRLENTIGILGFAENLPFPSGYFDAIVCSDALEHLFNPKEALKEMERVLKPGGQLLISTPSKLPFLLWGAIICVPRFVKRLLLNNRSKGAYDAPLYSSKLKSLLSNSGLQINNFKNSVLLIPEFYYQFLPDKLVSLSIKFANLFEIKYDSLNFLRLYTLVEAHKL